MYERRLSPCIFEYPHRYTMYVISSVYPELYVVANQFIEYPEPTSRNSRRSLNIVGESNLNHYSLTELWRTRRLEPWISLCPWYETPKYIRRKIKLNSWYWKKDYISYIRVAKKWMSEFREWLYSPSDSKFSSSWVPWWLYSSWDSKFSSSLLSGYLPVNQVCHVFST